MSQLTPTFPNLRVLFVEDSAVNRKLMVKNLEKLGCDVTEAKDGREAVTRFVDGQFDVVLMDVQMPVMDGIAATRIIRQHEYASGGHTPIIAVTAGMDRESCMDAGMDDHLLKPVKNHQIVASIQKVMHLNSEV